MTGEDDADLVAAGKGLVELLGSASRIGEDDINALAMERLDDYICAIHLAADFGLGERGGRGGRFHGGEKVGEKRRAKRPAWGAGKTYG